MAPDSGGVIFLQISAVTAKAAVGSLYAGNRVFSRVMEHQGCCCGTSGHTGPPGRRHRDGGPGAPLSHSPSGDSRTGSMDIGV